MSNVIFEKSADPICHRFVVYFFIERYAEESFDDRVTRNLLSECLCFERFIRIIDDLLDFIAGDFVDNFDEIIIIGEVKECT